jgi:hypothetical protein
MAFDAPFMKQRPNSSPTDLTDVPLRRVVYHALLAYILPLGAFNRWAGIRTIMHVTASHLKPVWVHRIELASEGKLKAIVRRLKQL